MRRGFNNQGVQHGESNFNIARATVADSDAILACLRAAFEAYRAEYTADAYADTVMNPKTVRQRIERMTLFVARNDADEIIGTIGGGSRGAEGHIRGMAVLPSAQALALPISCSKPSNDTWPRPAVRS